MLCDKAIEGVQSHHRNVGVLGFQCQSLINTFRPCSSRSSSVTSLIASSGCALHA